MYAFFFVPEYFCVLWMYITSLSVCDSQQQHAHAYVQTFHERCVSLWGRFQLHFHALHTLEWKVAECTLTTLLGKSIWGVAWLGKLTNKSLTICCHIPVYLTITQKQWYLKRIFKNRKIHWKYTNYFEVYWVLRVWRRVYASSERHIGIEILYIQHNCLRQFVAFIFPLNFHLNQGYVIWWRVLPGWNQINLRIDCFTTYCLDKRDELLFIFIVAFWKSELLTRDWKANDLYKNKHVFIIYTHVFL